jgi:hypothetical protein
MEVDPPPHRALAFDGRRLLAARERLTPGLLPVFDFYRNVWEKTCIMPTFSQELSGDQEDSFLFLVNREQWHRSAVSKRFRLEVDLHRVMSLDVEYASRDGTTRPTLAHFSSLEGTARRSFTKR